MGSDTTRASEATSTLPGRQTRPRSLRSRSTIMTCSARSLAAAESSVGRGAIGGRVGAAGAGPLDRARLDHAVRREREKSLGRVAEDGDGVLPRTCRVSAGDERGVRRRRTGTQSRRKKRRIAGGAGGAQPSRQVHLIGISRLQVVEDSPDAVQERRLRVDGLQRAQDWMLRRTLRRTLCRTWARQQVSQATRSVAVARMNRRRAALVADPDCIVKVKLEQWVVNLAGLQADQAASDSYESQPTATGTPAGASPSPPQAARASDHACSTLARSPGPRAADRGGGPGAHQIARNPRLVGGRRRQPEGARRSRRPPGRLGRRQARGRNGQHAYARASASAAFRKLRMYCTIEKSDTPVET